MLLSDGFLETARRRLDPSSVPTEADLRRATSDLYYALLHQISETLASLVPVEPDPVPLIVKEVWVALYRLPDHDHVGKMCEDRRLREFPSGIQQFASQLRTLRTLRAEADYNGQAQFVASEVRQTFQSVETAIRGFRGADPSITRAFALFVSLRKR